MRRMTVMVGVIGLLVAGLAVPASGAPPERPEERPAVGFPDLEQEVVVLINHTREMACTPEAVAAETALVEWLEGGMIGEPPPPPPEVEGLEPVDVQHVETGQGALVVKVMAKDLHIELWALDAPEDRPLVGPCLDTDDTMTLLATGTTSFHVNDNDLFFSDTRANAFGDRGHATLTSTADGTTHSYSWRFHVSSRCGGPEAMEPPCLMDESSLSPPL
jgi:hypothetical protein